MASTQRLISGFYNADKPFELQVILRDCTIGAVSLTASCAYRATSRLHQA